jgi:hypothetical protein
MEGLADMRFRVVLSLMTMALACFTVAVWNSPLPDESREFTPPEESGSSAI